MEKKTKTKSEFKYNSLATSAYYTPSCFPRSRRPVKSHGFIGRMHTSLAYARESEWHERHEGRWDEARWHALSVCTGCITDPEQQTVHLVPLSHSRHS